MVLQVVGKERVIRRLEEERERIIRILEDFFREKGEEYSILIALLYGSWREGVMREDSDVDIAVYFDRALEEEERRKRVRKITAELEERIGREISVLDLREDFPQPMVYYNAIVSGEPVYVRDLSLLHHLRMDTIHMMEDFSSRGLRWQMEIAGKYLEKK